MDSVKLARLRNAFHQAELNDILVPGFLDTSVHPFEFHFQFQDVFLKLHRGFLRLATIGYEGRFEFRVTTSLRTERDLGGFAPAIVSVSDLYLPNLSLPAPISKVEVWGAGSAGETISCAALQIEVVGRKVFFDPSYDFGFRLGDERQHAIWVSNLPGSEPERLELWREEGR